MIRRAKHHRHFNQEERWIEKKETEREDKQRERKGFKHTHTERESERDKVEDTVTTLYHKVTLTLPAAIL